MAYVNLISPLERTTKIAVPLPTGGATKGNVVTVGQVTGFYFATVEEGTISYTPSNGETAVTGIELEDRQAPNQTVNALVIYKAPRVTADKATGVSFTRGAKVYWDAAANKVTTATTGTTLVGIAEEAAASATTTLDMEWDGTLANF